MRVDIYNCGPRRQVASLRGREVRGRNRPRRVIDAISSAEVLKALRRAAEGPEEDGWREVYIDNAIPAGMTVRSFRSHLATLAGRGLYRPIDNYAWGRVRVA